MSTTNGHHPINTALEDSSLWREGRAEVDVTASTAEAALGLALQAILRLSQMPDSMIPASGSLTAPISGEAGTLAGAIEGLIENMLDQLASANEAATAVRVDGLLRGERGVTAWGGVEFARGHRNRARSLFLDGAVWVEELAGSSTIRFHVRRLNG